MGVLRAIGVTRFGLVRMILAEAILVGIVACLLSLGFGVMAGYCGTGITRYINIRGGQIVPLIIPWAKLTIGFGATLGLCLLAALWPAITTGRRTLEAPASGACCYVTCATLLGRRLAWDSACGPHGAGADFHARHVEVHRVSPRPHPSLAARCKEYKIGIALVTSFRPRGPMGIPRPASDHNTGIKFILETCRSLFNYARRNRHLSPYDE